MTDYSVQTDDEINAEVALITGDHSADGTYPDYCNDWAAIGPVIEGEKIDVDYDGTSWYASNHSNKYQKITPWGEGNNPKRAAAICFLMMQEEG